uniref:HP domain-containing protein n=1 Tax=Octactis speculum TaxID=3111310 RepID=A0A7S2B2Y4_9STRA|mmetsp:Transcript_18906/g.25627  ORF Transcript_18906/g.25627 Transcript_18906/m.25627 type:complete len:240 (+) Transcript_18906:205-924(+)
MSSSDSNNATKNIVRMNSQTTVYFPSSSSFDASEATAANDGADPGNSLFRANSSTRSRAVSDSPMISLAEVYTTNLSESHKTLSTSQSARRTLDKFQEYNAACVFSPNPDTDAALPTSLSAFQVPKQKTAATRKVDGGEKFMKVDITKDSTIQPKPVDEGPSEEQRREADEDHERMLENIRSYSSLLAIKENTEKLDILKKEDYLEESEFERILGTTRKEFNAMPKWKRDRKKKEVGLF